MASHPLDGSRLKIVRAKEHLDAFIAESRAFIDTKPYSFVSQVYPTHWWVKPHLTAAPPPRLSLLVGDCVTNIRASLDYVVWQLASRYFNPPIDLSRQIDRTTLSFPILLADPRRRQSHIDHLDRLARRGMPAGAIDIFRNAQGDAGGDDQLRWLYDLVNTDKHRFPILTIGVFVASQIEITGFQGNNLLIRHDLLDQGVAVKAESIAPDLLKFLQESPMNVNVQSAIAITSPDLPMVEAPLEWTLEQIVEFSAHLIERFNPLLS
jgi:hypothetical protein